MPKKIKDTDYLVISARIKAMEANLLTNERMERLLSARTGEELSRVIQECGYPAFDTEDQAAMDAALSKAREDTLTDLGDGAPDAGYLDIFKLKYDYHNAKAILKAKAMGTAPDSMLMELGRVPSSVLEAAVREGDGGELPGLLAPAVAEAKRVLDTTRDPQLSDIVLDRWCWQDELDAAEATGSAFLTGYVRTRIDAANLRALVRTLRMGKSAEFLRDVLADGGAIPAESVLQAAAANGGGLTELYGPTAFHDAAEAGADALKGGPLTEFERRCDDAVGEYLSGAQMVPFGEAPLVGYLAARETEYTNLRILLLGRKAGLSPEIIRSRLRAGYV